MAARLRPDRCTPLVLLLLLAGAGTPAAAAEMASDYAEAEALALRFQAALQSRLQAAMAAGGPVGAITVCKEDAPAIASQLSRDSGWQVKRVGVRVRNPLTGLPDAWEQARLRDMQQRLAGGSTPESLVVRVRVEEPAGVALRYMRPIITAPVCLACHGPADGLGPEVRAALGREYPYDAATGFTPGEMRGAFSLRKPSPPAAAGQP